MNEDRDPILQSLFADAEQDLAGEAFIARVLAQTNSLRRKAANRAIVGWIGAGLVFALGAWWVATPLHNGVQLLTQGLTVSLIELQDQGLAQLLFPVNNIAGLLALGLIGLRIAYRKIFRGG